MSLSLMREIVLQGGIDAGTPELNELEIYPFAYDSTQKLMSFCIEFESAGKHFRYNLEIEVDPFSSKGKRKIISEVLAMSNERTLVPLFMRDETKVGIQRIKPALDMLGGSENCWASLRSGSTRTSIPHGCF